MWRERDGGATGYAECWRRSYGDVAGVRLSAEEMRAFAAALLGGIRPVSAAIGQRWAMRRNPDHVVTVIGWDSNDFTGEDYAVIRGPRNTVRIRPRVLWKEYRPLDAADVPPTVHGCPHCKCADDEKAPPGSTGRGRSNHGGAVSGEGASGR